MATGDSHTNWKVMCDTQEVRTKDFQNPRKAESFPSCGRGCRIRHRFMQKVSVELGAAAAPREKLGVGGAARKHGRRVTQQAWGTSSQSMVPEHWCMKSKLFSSFAFFTLIPSRV